jgi:hypothetical protein
MIKNNNCPKPRCLIIYKYACKSEIVKRKASLSKKNQVSATLAAAVSNAVGRQ